MMINRSKSTWREFAVMQLLNRLLACLLEGRAVYGFGAGGRKLIRTSIARPSSGSAFV
jgi:hypothetical protein